MQQILTVTTPFFALVLLGWLVVRWGWLPQDSVAGMNAFVLFFALPCMLLRFSATTPIAQLLDGAVVTVYLASAVLVVAAALLVARRRGLAWRDAAFGALVSAFPNSGFIGVPLLVALLGAAAAAPAIVALALDMVVTTSLCIALSQLGHHAGGGARAAVWRALRGMMSNPLPWSIAIGTLVSATGWQLPALVLRPIEMLAVAASPVALFALGGLLARRPSTASAAPAPGRLDVAGLVAFKLVLHPLVVFAAACIGIAAGLPLDRFAAAVLVLVAALPGASNVPIVAERFGADAARTARAVLFGTVGAFASFTVAVAWLDAPVVAPPVAQAPAATR